MAATECFNLSWERHSKDQDMEIDVTQIQIRPNLSTVKVIKHWNKLP